MQRKGFSPYDLAHSVSCLIPAKQLFRHISRRAATFPAFPFKSWPSSFWQAVDLRLVLPLRGCHTLGGDFQPDPAAQQLGQHSSPETLSEAALGSSRNHKLSQTSPDQSSTVGMHWELDPRGIPVHRYAGQIESIPVHLACGQHRQAYLLHFIVRKWWARSPKVFRCFDI